MRGAFLLVWRCGGTRRSAQEQFDGTDLTEPIRRNRFDETDLTKPAGAPKSSSSS
eukprot:CAMPEP_0119361938 /NCGR_PEP_ID=MMETSP1334-20130426/9139_1 /TAXON_ID=127549 /ORGANISM="Calcidiscus leptoporus, Strain RCC1130" /LENGTH=54 /DNA_ID=CAMNT_0007377073 /DNA_START=310 /DNA_END=471 /DNA_ORIENTATION=+